MALMGALGIGTRGRHRRRHSGKRRRRHHSKIGRKVIFHGAFDTRAAANRKHKETARSYVQRSTIKGRVRYLVLVRRHGG